MSDQGHGCTPYRLTFAGRLKGAASEDIHELLVTADSPEKAWRRVYEKGFEAWISRLRCEDLTEECREAFEAHLKELA